MTGEIKGLSEENKVLKEKILKKDFFREYDMQRKEVDGLKK